MIRLSILLSMLAFQASPQPVSKLDFPGLINAGGLKIPARFAVNCAMDGVNVNNISFSLAIVQVSSLRKVFDLDALEGPYGKQVSGQLLVTGSGSPTKLSFSPSGSNINEGYEFDGGFVPPPRASAKRYESARALLDSLSKGPAQLAWRIANPSPKGPPIDAMISLTDADAAHLRRIAAPCLTK